MFVTCSQCGYENDTQHHFCGMCGEPLRAPYSNPAPVNKPVPGISGPSVLGLGSAAPARSVDYLLEDDEEPHRGRGFVYFVLLLVLGVAAVTAWRLHQGVYPWESRSQRPVTTDSSNPGQPAAQAPAPNATAESSPTAATLAPQTPASQSPAAQPANSSITDIPPGGSASTAAPSQASDAAAAAPAPDSAASHADQASSQPPAESKPAPAQAPQAKPGPPKSKARVTRQAATADDDSADDSGDDDAATASAPPPRRASKPDPRQVALSSPAADPTEAWVLDGQKYLYGNGVPQNCARAKAQLLAAAARSNAQAQSTLGAMYATGHCVDRDVVSAYRWFAQALQNDRSNTRIQQDLQVLWNQMTPQEKQAAMQSRR